MNLEFPLREFNLLPPNGWLSEEEARLLWLAASNTRGTILEVGCYYGRSTCLLSLLGRPMMCVDPFEGFDPDEPTGQLALQGWRNNVTKWLRLRSEESWCPGVADLLTCRVEDCDPRPCGFAYLDGDHTFQGTMAQIDFARRCGVTNACLHDYDTRGGGLEIKRAVEESGSKLLEVRGRMAHCLLSLK